ncbi:helix-turn-helix domain-containing protein [Micromonospora cremea]|uniref:helix-turn-helix domain-containing protein n=1 Tax=Micromonospora cremea TaxID=709881 RepID=UPI003CC7C6D3
MQQLASFSVRFPSSTTAAFAFGGHWRRLPARQQALMTPAHLRNGDTLTRLAAGIEVSVTTVWRYLRRTTPVSTSAAA